MTVRRHRNVGTISLVGALLTLCASPVWAVTFTGTAVGSWQNVVSVDSLDVYSLNNGDVGSVARFNWGIPATTTFDNQFTFDGVGSDGDPEWSTTSESPFLVGNFSYRNGSTYNSAGINGVDLNLQLSITSPTGIVDTFLFDFAITNTPNDTGNPVLDGDIVTVTTSFSPTTFSYGGVDYTLELLGFSSDGGTTIRTNFSSPEAATANAGVYGRITSQIPAPIPEPGTMILLGSGLVGLAGYGRRRKK